MLRGLQLTELDWSNAGLAASWPGSLGSWNAGLSDAWLDALGGQGMPLTSLRVALFPLVYLTPLGDGLAALRTLSKLEIINPGCTTAVSDAGIEAIGSMSLLEDLCLEHVAGFSSIGPLRGATRLKRLSMRKCLEV